MSFSFYTVDTKYCDYLRIYDDKIPYTMEKKSTRPFGG
ncbi:MAG: type III toxin-antitoxin system ToxN/AbiQ family toxin [Flexilinea sp.]|nr:type III toxin-antitoxin system ToxN/AbiQ family toxin [Flexilinea sp.]